MRNKKFTKKKKEGTNMQINIRTREKRKKKRNAKNKRTRYRGSGPEKKVLPKHFGQWRFCPPSLFSLSFLFSSFPSKKCHELNVSASGGL
jgi:hypothetical protein